MLKLRIVYVLLRRVLDDNLPYSFDVDFFLLRLAILSGFAGAVLELKVKSC